MKTFATFMVLRSGAGMNKAKHSLLVVDDEPDMVHSVKDLCRYEYHVFGATRAAEGLRIMANEPINIVLSDQCMPEMTGVDFLSQLRGTYPDTVRLLFTAYSDLHAVVDAINKGSVYRYISKPWEPDDLQAVLRQASEYHDLLEDRKKLLAEVQKQNVALERANRDLKQANEMKKAFIKVASHELRTPLTIMLGLAELAQRTPDLLEPLRGWLERIVAGSLRLNERVDLMIKLLMADQYERPLLRSDVNVANLLWHAADEVASFIDRRKQRLEVQVPADLGTVHTDGDKIRDSLMQLLVNAIKFTPDGGTIRLTARKSDDNQIEIRVIDTGMGIDPQCLPRIFEPFFTRFDVSKHRSGVYEFDRRGMGLGLSVAKSFIEMQGGALSVESKLGEGSTFTIRLPRQPAASLNGK